MSLYQARTGSWTQEDRLMECLDRFEKYLHVEERPYASLDILEKGAEPIVY